MKITTTLVLAALVGLSAQANAQDYPQRPVKLVVPFAPGGNVDLTARIISTRLGELLGQPVVVDNRGGAGGSIGAAAVAKAPADGYTLLMGASGPLSINPVAMPKLPYDVMKDFAPIAQVHSVPLVVVVNPKSGIASIRQLIELARAGDGKVAAASAGTGTMNHMAIELFGVMAGVKLGHVPYKGSGPALNDVLAGQVPAMFDQVNSSIGFLRDGRLRPLAVTSPKRVPALPDVPTLDELGLKGYEAGSFVGVLAPAGTPPGVVARLNEAVRKTLETPAVQQKLRELGADVRTGTPEQFQQLIAGELEKWRRVARQAGVVFE